MTITKYILVILNNMPTQLRMLYLHNRIHKIFNNKS